jgi:hypothetical protein
MEIMRKNDVKKIIAFDPENCQNTLIPGQHFCPQFFLFCFAVLEKRAVKCL